MHRTHERAKLAQWRQDIGAQRAAGMENKAFTGIGMADRGKLLHDFWDRRIGNRYENDRNEKDFAGNCRSGMAAADGADCAPRRGLAARDHRMNLPTSLAETATERASETSRADDGNAVIRHHVRIPCRRH